MTRIINYSLIGALVGLSTSYIVMTLVLLGDSSATLNGQELLLQLVLAFILGIACGLISLIFTIDRYPYLVKLAIHYVVILAVVLICGVIGDWYDPPTEEPIRFMFFIFIQLFIYIVISIGVYLMDLQQLKKINEKLQRRKGH